MAASKTHVIFDEDTAQYLQDLSGKTGWSINRIANHLIRNIRSVEIATDIQMKTDGSIPIPGSKPVTFKKRIHMKIRV